MIIKKKKHPIFSFYFVNCYSLNESFYYLLAHILTVRCGNRAGRAELDRANSGPGQNRAGPKLARFFRAKILTAQPALKTGLVGPNSLFKAKKKFGRAGPGHTGPSHIRPSQIWPGFFWANNLMAQPGPNSGQTGLAHRVGPILPLLLTVKLCTNKSAQQYYF